MDIWVGTRSAWHSKIEGGAALSKSSMYVSGLLLYKVCIN